ncbi:hypothetical protein ACEPAF_8166 [Sanghuangporus sanghuang]
MGISPPLSDLAEDKRTYQLCQWIFQGSRSVAVENVENNAFNTCFPQKLYSTVYHVARRLALRVGLQINTLTHVWRRAPYAVPSRHISNETYRPDAAYSREDLARQRDRTKAVHDLAFLVSQQNAQSPSPKLQTPHDIKGFYLAVKTKGLLCELSSEELSSLIRLFGSLSILPNLDNDSTAFRDNNTDAFALHPLAPILHRYQTIGRRAHWGFVLSVAKDKTSHGLRLGESDNFWLMRAALEDVKRLSAEEPEGDNIKLCLDRAKNYYLRIKSPNDAWSVHQIYLSALLDYGGHESCDEVLARLGNLLSWKGGLPASLRILLWRVVVFPGASIAKSTKARFLHILRKKLSQVQDILPMYSNRAAKEVGRASLDSTVQSRYHDALTIRDYFADIIFSFRPGTHPTLRYLHEVYPWALFEARAALCAFNDGTFATLDDEDRASWNNLVLLSLSFASARNGPGSLSAAGAAPQQGFDGGVDSQSQVLGWTVICSLAALSSELHIRSPLHKVTNPAAAHRIQEISRTLWILWRKEEAWRAGAVMRSMPLICCSTTSFMALASVSGDSRLAISLVRHIADSIIYPAQLGSEVLDRSMLHECAVHFAVLTATWGVGTPPQHSWDGILGALRYAQLIPDGNGSQSVRCLSSIADALVMHLVRKHLMLANGLVTSAAEHGLSISGDVLLSVGKALASEGHFELVLDYLKDGRMPGSTSSLLLNAVMDSLLRYHQDKLRPNIVQSFVEIVTKKSILPTNNHALETFIHLCIRAGHIKEAVKIVGAVCRSSSTLLSPSFLAELVTALISHRHYKLLGEILKDAWHKMPGRRASLFRGYRLRYTRQLLSLFPKVTSQEIARSLPFSVYVWPVLKDHIPFHPRLAQLNKKVISLKLSSQLQKMGRLDEKTLERAVHLLVDAGRITSAVKLLNKHSPDKVPTKAGNIILSASLRPTRKGRRQVRHASTRLAQLIEERGFVPDRVTLNLLMKALLRWKSITPTSTIRALFDKLLINGYPMPENMPTVPSGPVAASTPEQHNTPPATRSRSLFGTDGSTSKRKSLPVNLQAFPKHISFTRHTRPLYKMFVKALEARGDREGAARITNVLRQVEEKEMQQIAIRAEARRFGRIKAREKARRAGAPKKQ